MIKLNNKEITLEEFEEYSKNNDTMDTLIMTSETIDQKTHPNVAKILRSHNFLEDDRFYVNHCCFIGEGKP